MALKPSPWVRMDMAHCDPFKTLFQYTTVLM